MDRLERSMESRPGGIKLVAVAVVLSSTLACTSGEPDDVALATQCMRASDDNRAKLSASWLSSAEIDVSGDSITVRTEVPVGIGIDATVKFHHWVYRCRRRGNEVEFLSFERAG